MAHVVTIKFTAPVNERTEAAVRDWVKLTVKLPETIDAEVEVEHFESECFEVTCPHCKETELIPHTALKGLVCMHCAEYADLTDWSPKLVTT